MVAAILNVAMGMIGAFAFLLFLLLACAALLSILAVVYCAITELWSWIKELFN